jgi:hypothetical protein
MSVGLSVRGYTQMAAAAARAGVATKELTAGLANFRSISFAASRGDQQSSALLASLGVNGQGSTEQQLNQAVSGLNRLGSARDSVAQKLFGARGAEIASGLNGAKGAGGISGGAAAGFERANTQIGQMFGGAVNFALQNLYDFSTRNNPAQREQDAGIAASRVAGVKANEQFKADIAQFPGLLSPAQQYSKQAQLIANARKNIGDEQAGRYLAEAKLDYLSQVQPIGAAPSGATDTSAGAALVLGAQRQSVLYQTRMSQLGGIDQGIFGAAINGIQAFTNTFWKREGFPLRQLFDGL